MADLKFKPKPNILLICDNWTVSSTFCYNWSISLKNKVFVTYSIENV